MGGSSPRGTVASAGFAGEEKTIGSSCLSSQRARVSPRGGGKGKQKRKKSTHRECKGSSICEHNRIRSQCAECEGSRICPYKRRKSHCLEFRGSSICRHNRCRSRCKDCRDSTAPMKHSTADKVPRRMLPGEHVALFKLQFARVNPPPREHAWIGLAARPCGGSVHGTQSTNAQYSYEGNVRSCAAANRGIPASYRQTYGLALQDSRRSASPSGPTVQDSAAIRRRTEQKTSIWK